MPHIDIASETSVQEAIEKIKKIEGGMRLVKYEPYNTYPPKPPKTYKANSIVIYNGELWKNTSGNDVTNEIKPGTNYKVWNIMRSNPNLLDNPWFTVNQRGKSEYLERGYCVDRWTKKTDSLRLSVLDNGIHLSAIGSVFNQTLNQNFDEHDYLKIGEKYTASILYADSSISFVTGEAVDYMTFKSYYLEGSHTNMIDYVKINNNNFGINALDGCSIDILAVKLEKGSISTILNDTSPDYTTELIKCMLSTADPSDTYANKKLLTN